MENEELQRERYEWQGNSSIFESWVNKLKEELDKMGLGYIWQN